MPFEDGQARASDGDKAPILQFRQWGGRDAEACQNSNDEWWMPLCHVTSFSIVPRNVFVAVML